MNLNLKCHKSIQIGCQTHSKLHLSHYSIQTVTLFFFFFVLEGTLGVSLFKPCFTSCILEWGSGRNDLTQVLKLSVSPLSSELVDADTWPNPALSHRSHRSDGERKHADIYPTEFCVIKGGCAGCYQIMSIVWADIYWMLNCARYCFKCFSWIKLSYYLSHVNFMMTLRGPIF